MDDFPVRTDQFSIKSYDVDSAGRLKFTSLLQYFQEIAGHHAAELGVGYEELGRRGAIWVLSRLRIDVSSMPAWGTGVTLLTRPIGVNRLFAMREFSMTDAAGGTLLSAITGWVVLDRTTNRPGRIQLLPLAPHLKQERPAPPDFLEKLVPPQRLAPLYEKKVLASEIDVNNHVNNAEYVRWIVDAFAPEQLAGRPIRRLRVHYLDAATFGETIAINGGADEQDEARFYVEATNPATGARVFQALISWS